MCVNKSAFGAQVIDLEERLAGQRHVPAGADRPAPGTDALTDVLNEHLWMLEVLQDLQDYARTHDLEAVVDDLRVTADRILDELYCRGGVCNAT